LESSSFKENLAFTPQEITLLIYDSRDILAEFAINHQGGIMNATVIDNTTVRPHCGVCWSAIFAGALVAFALGALFNLLNTGLGLVTFPESFRASVALSIGGYIWLIICGIIAMFIAGFVAGKIFRRSTEGGSCGGFLHGFLAWSLALLLSLLIAAHFAHIAAPAFANAKTENTAVATNQNEAAPLNQRELQQAADVLGGATLGIFIIFLIGALSAGVGGYVAARRDSVTTTRV
jgi:hypothetical protein